MPALRGQIAPQKKSLMSALIISIFGIMVADLLAFGFGSGVFAFPIILFDMLAVFFLSFFLYQFMDGGLDRIFTVGLLSGFFVTLMSALAAGSLIVIAPVLVIGGTFMAVFVGVLIVALLLEYTKFSNK